MMAAAVDADLQRRFSGLERLYGVPGAAAIRGAHVAVVGIGGVGSWAVEALARSGVGRITLIDFDQVSESNINRQIHAETDTVGMAKVDAMAQRIARINPKCVVHRQEEFATPENWPGMVAATAAAMDPFDAVIDACDQVKAKTAMAAWARAQKTSLYITAGAAGGKRLAHWVDIADLSETTHDPLLAKLRYNLRRAHGAPQGGDKNTSDKSKRIGIACVFSREAVAPPDASCTVEGMGVGVGVGVGDSSLNCHGYGSVVSVTASFGLCAAGWVLDALAKRAAP